MCLLSGVASFRLGSFFALSYQDYFIRIFEEAGHNIDALDYCSEKSLEAFEARCSPLPCQWGPCIMGTCVQFLSDRSPTLEDLEM